MATEDPEAPIDRADIVEAMSWAEDFTRGRWGTQFASETLDRYDAQVRAELAAEVESLHAKLVATASDSIEANLDYLGQLAVTEQQSDELDRLQEEREAVLAIHVKEGRSNWCDHDEQIWPCATARALGAS